MRENQTFAWAITFLIIAMIAGVLGFSGFAGTTTPLAYIGFVTSIITAVVLLLKGR